MPTIKYDEVKSAKATLIFAHGAGANMYHTFMENMTALLNLANINVVRFNFPYMDKRELTGKKYPPNRLPVLIECYQTVIESITSAKHPLFIGGKSMGGRVAAHVAIEYQQIKGAICIGYPFHPINKPDKLRLAPLQTATKPICILQGDRDKLGNREEISQYQLPKLCSVNYFSDGDHDLKPRVKSGYTHKQHIQAAVNTISDFIDEHI